MRDIILGCVGERCWTRFGIVSDFSCEKQLECIVAQWRVTLRKTLDCEKLSNLKKSRSSRIKRTIENFRKM